MSEIHFKQITDWAGSQADLARLLGCSRAAVSLWRHTGIPAYRAVQIERLSGGKWKAAQIARPDDA